MNLACAVWRGYYEGNLRSHHVMEKLSFVYRHTTRGLAVPRPGEEQTGHVMRLPREVWLDAQASF